MILIDPIALTSLSYGDGFDPVAGALVCELQASDAAASVPISFTRIPNGMTEFLLACGWSGELVVGTVTPDCTIVDSKRYPPWQKHVSINEQYGFTRRELEAVRSPTASVDLSAMIEARANIVRVPYSALEKLLDAELLEAVMGARL